MFSRKDINEDKIEVIKFKKHSTLRITKVTPAV